MVVIKNKTLIENSTQRILQISIRNVHCNYFVYENISNNFKFKTYTLIFAFLANTKAI